MPERFQIHPAVASTDVEGEYTILDPRSGLYFGLDGPGAVMWEALEHPRSLAELVDVLLERFEVGREECFRDVAALVEELRDRGLLQTCG